jgi:small subunit ribosomal protein S20
MANTKSTKKNVRSAARKRAHNSGWKTKVRDAVKSIKKGIATRSQDASDMIKKLQALQKATDKASKEKVIHKNMANRLKSMYARKISALLSSKPSKSGK